MTATVERTELVRLPAGGAVTGGLTAEVWPHGGLRWLRHITDTGELMVNLHPASGLESGPANLWLRRWDGDDVVVHPLLGPASGAVLEHTDATATVRGSWAGLGYRATLALAPDRPSWRWSVEVVREAAAGGDAAPVVIDLVWTQDVGLAGRGVVRANELYVSQYLDITPLTSERVGTVLAVRQNQAQAGCHPWLLLGSDHRAERYATDARQVFGLALRNGQDLDEAAGPGLLGDLPSRRLQHEHSVAAVQTPRTELPPGARWSTGFFGHLVPDHPAPTGPADLDLLDEILDSALPPADLPGDQRNRHPGSWAAEADVRPDPSSTGTIFSPARLWESDHLVEQEVISEWGDPRVPECDADGRLLSFVTGTDQHVVLRAKEQTVLRPHGRLLRAGDGLLPDPDGVAVTTWMTGSPLSYLTRGHASTDRLLSTVRGYLGWHRAYGLRVFVQQDGRWLLLDQPSAYEMSLDRCRWLYRSGDQQIDITTTVPAGGHAVEVEIEVVSGPPQAFLVALGLAEGDDGLEPGPVALQVSSHASGTRLTLGPAPLVVDVGGAVQVDDDGPLFLDGRSRGLRWVSITTPPRDLVTLGIGADHDHAGTGAREDSWSQLCGSVAVDPAGDADLLPVTAALPWLLSDALTHYLSPRGLEQYTGGAWGTRDVSQGPVELLLALGRFAELRQLLIMIMRAQDPDGEWPQAFGFLPDDHLRLGPPHGDVIFWPILAVGRYLLASGDRSLLAEEVPYADGSSATVADHLRQALELAAERMLPGTHLTAYGHGDWNDSLQPADPRLAAELTSTWTVTLHHQALTTLADGLHAAGLPDWGDRLRGDAAVISGEFADHLMPFWTEDGPEGIVAGYARFVNGRPTSYLVHPRDTETGLSYSVLPMIHGIVAGLFTPDETRQHLLLIDEYLRGADGIRLFDAPPTYRGGRMVHFQRAETATFVGREIGLMYTHAHLRHLEALALVGDAEDLWRSLRQVINFDHAAAVPNARPRQANCYTSSSDAVVADRQDFADRYGDLLAGAVPVEAGWRVYSSGPGILVRLIRECLLGLRIRAYGLEVDPVLTTRFDGVRTTVQLGGRRLRIAYRVATDGGPVTALRVGGTPLETGGGGTPLETGGGGTPLETGGGGTPLETRRLDNPYRIGGLLIPTEQLAALPDGAELEVVVG